MRADAGASKPKRAIGEKIFDAGAAHFAVGRKAALAGKVRSFLQRGHAAGCPAWRSGNRNRWRQPGQLVWKNGGADRRSQCPSQYTSPPRSVRPPAASTIAIGHPAFGNEVREEFALPLPNEMRPRAE